MLSLVRYITRHDGSPLMDALSLWRDGALRSKYAQVSSRPVSPGRSDDGDLSEPLPLDTPSESGSARIDQSPPNSARKPSSSSWVRWWRRRETDNSRPELRPVNSAPSEVVGYLLFTLLFPPSLKLLFCSRNPCRHGLMTYYNL